MKVRQNTVNCIAANIPRVLLFSHSTLQFEICFITCPSVMLLITFWDLCFITIFYNNRLNVYFTMVKRSFIKMTLTFACIFKIHFYYIQVVSPRWLRAISLSWLGMKYVFDLVTMSVSSHKHTPDPIKLKLHGKPVSNQNVSYDIVMQYSVTPSLCHSVQRWPTGRKTRRILRASLSNCSWRYKRTENVISLLNWEYALKPCGLSSIVPITVRVRG